MEKNESACAFKEVKRLYEEFHFTSWLLKYTIAVNRKPKPEFERYINDIQNGTRKILGW